MMPQHNLFLNFFISTLFILASTPAQAQITLDNTLGAERSNIRQNVLINGASSDLINGGAIRGSNLFHSFTEFNVGDGQRVYFGNPSGIENILTRVTGGNASNILGTLGVNGAANLFLINPNGILFGQNARLDVRGSFMGTTASSVKFADGREFSATTPQNIPLLTISVPLGLQFGVNPQKITVQGDETGLRSTVDLIDTNSGLRVPSNQTLALVGGDINLEGATIKTAGGRIELGSVSGEGLVSFSPTDKGFLLGYDAVQNFGNIQLIQKASVDASGTGAGDVLVTGKRVTLSDGSAIEASTLGANNGGGLVVNATESVELNNTLTALAAQVYPGATGDGGNLRISTKDLLVRDGAFISSSTFGKGNGGNLTLNASGSVQLIGGGLNSSANQYSTGNAGDITVNTQTINLSNQAIIRSSNTGQGNTGNILIQAQDNFSANNSLIASNIGSPQRQPANGNVGNIEISARTVSLTDGAQLQAGFYSGSEGNAGLVSVKAQDTISFTGTNSGIFTNVESGAVGNGSDIQISARSISFTDGAVLFSSNDGQGNGGNIDINTQNLLLRNGATVFSGTSGKGNGGNLTLNASGSVQFIDGGLNSSTQPGSIGNAGNITLKAQTINFSNAGYITSSTLGQGRGGKITLKAEDTISLPSGSEITSNSGASGFGGVNSESSGDIEIRARKLSIDGGANTFITSSITSRNLDDGKAGNIQIIADDFISLNGLVSISSSSTGKGDGGNIELQTRSLTLANGGSIGTQASGRGSSGNLLVNASDSVSLSGIATFLNPQTGETITTNSGLATSAFGTGNSGQLTINTERLSVRDGGHISTATSSQLGRAGDLTIDAKDSLDVVGGSPSRSSTISTITLGSGDAGSLNISTGHLNIRDGGIVTTSTLSTGKAGNLTIDAKDSLDVVGGSPSRSSTISTSTFGSGDAGNLTIKTQDLLVQDGAQVIASTLGKGNAGNLTVNADHSVQLIGRSADSPFLTGLGAAGANLNSTGNAGDLTINTPQLLVRDGARVSVTNTGTGNAGILTINADRIHLDNKASLNANTRSSNKDPNREQATINLNTQDLILRRNSNITTNATGKDVIGGNINIDTDFLIALENSDISANSTDFRGGRVRIAAQGIYGTQPRNALTSESDITATGASPQFSGSTEINTPDVDPTQALIKLPDERIDASNQIGQICPRGGYAKKPLGEFVVSGRGSLPPSPLQSMTGTPNLIPLATLEEETATGGRGDGKTRVSGEITPVINNGSSAIIEAQGFARTPEGKIIIVAHAPQTTPSSRPTAAACPTSN